MAQVANFQNFSDGVGSSFTMCVSLFELSSYVQSVCVCGGRGRGVLGSLCVYCLNYPHMSRLCGGGV